MQLFCQWILLILLFIGIPLKATISNADDRIISLLIHLLIITLMFGAGAFSKIF